MNENKPQVATWALGLDIDPDNPKSDPVCIAALDMPLDGGLISVGLAGNMGKATALTARAVCQSIDEALKRHLERGGSSDTPETLNRPPHRSDGRHSGRQAMTDLLTPPKA